MSRLTFSSFILSLAFLAVPLFAAQPCNLALSMSCASGSCTSTTINNGTNTCSGTLTGAVVPNGTTASVPRGVDGGAACTAIETVADSGPVAPEHCRAWTR